MKVQQEAVITYSTEYAATNNFLKLNNSQMLTSNYKTNNDLSFLYNDIFFKMCFYIKTNNKSLEQYTVTITEEQKTRKHFCCCFNHNFIL